MSAWLTPEEIVDLTDRKRWKAQCDALKQMGVPFRPNAAGRPLVERAAEIIETLRSGSLHEISKISDGEFPERKWFVITGANIAGILLFTSRAVAENYCRNNPHPAGYKIYGAVDALRATPADGDDHG